MAHSHPQPKSAQAEEESTTLDTVEVEGRATDLIGVATSASQGVVGQPEFKFRPLARVGELIEVVPGMLATQHSGTGKANQYFLRGFNLDHGTDFNVMVDGVPMNMPSHAHGQGYLDLNSLIPELVDKVEYGKGPYYSDIGDFSSAGYARFHTMHTLDKGFVKFTGGQYDFYRTVAANTNKIGDGELLYGGEMTFYDGVWQQPEDTKKYNGMLRYTIDKSDWGLSVNAKAYHNTWTATNQIPLYAVKEGQMGLYDTQDPSDGGISNRYSGSVNLWSRGDSWKNELNTYVVYSDLELYSNFTGFLDNPILGDQLQQKERRMIAGGSGEQTWFNNLFGFEMDNTVGFMVRYDGISGLALNHTSNRQLIDVRTNSNVDETHGGVFFRNQTHWLSKFRTVAGLRGDFYNFHVSSFSQPLNSGSRYAGLLSPKLTFIAGPWADTEFFLNLGYGYHSNDARGTTTHIDADGNLVDPVTPLVRSRGAEIGMRTQYVQGLNSTLSVWWLQLDSELVWIGDAGTNEPTGKSERYGVEWANYYKPTDWLTLDADFAFSAANYTGVPYTENRVPNSVRRVITAGAVVDHPSGFFGTMRVRHFGDVPLNEGNTFNAGDTTLLSLGAGYQKDFYKLEIEVFNLLDSKRYDIAYNYNYRTRSDAINGLNPDGVDGIVMHPVEPQMVRGTVMVKF
ncbi:MAG: TonB-dependent receptor [Candidatus Methylumidiphilus sp.]